MRFLPTLLLTIFFAMTLVGCGADDATRNNTFVPLTGISITSEHNGIANLTDNRFFATGNFSGALTRDITDEVTWESLDESVLTIDSTSLATAVSPGTATVRATFGEIEGTLDFNVSNATIVSLSVTPETQSAPVGVVRDFDVSGTFDDGTVQNLNRIATWSSLDPIIAGVTGTGAATGESVGTARIQAEWQGEIDIATLTVTAAELTDISITPADGDFPAGLIIPYTLTGTFSDGSTVNLTEQAIWESSIETCATVNNTAGRKGQVEMLSSGATDIKASYSDTVNGLLETSTSLTVNSATLLDLLISARVINSDGLVDRTEEISAGELLSIFNDQTVQMTVTGEYTNATEFDVTAQTDWSPSDPLIATISNITGFEGIISPAIDTGLTDITANFGNLTFTFTLDVNPR